MSSCFLCECSYVFNDNGNDVYTIAYNDGTGMFNLPKFMKQLPIMVGSTGTNVNDQQHNNNKKQNYVSYKVKKLEFCCSYKTLGGGLDGRSKLPDYVLIFKVPFRAPVFDYYFGVLNNFMLFSEPECVLGYKVLQSVQQGELNLGIKHPFKFNININKPFIVGPNDYVGVLYMFDTVSRENNLYVNGSARVWFDVL